MAVDVNIPATGAIAPPPAHATIETAQPVQADAGSIVVFSRETGQPTGEIVSPEARARQNERTLLPLTYGKTALESPVPGKDIGHVDPFYEELAKRKAARTADQIAADEAAAMPAASNSDSPSRGIPGTAPVPASRKRAPLKNEGGFGIGGGPEYFPIDGSEAREMALQLMDQLAERLKNDLRFTLATCYPRLAIKLQLIVDAVTSGGEAGFEIEYVAAHDKTALDVAKAHGDAVVFVLREQRREFNEAGEVETPPDAMRDELGLNKPKRQFVQTGTGKQMADRPLGW